MENGYFFSHTETYFKKDCAPVCFGLKSGAKLSTMGAFLFRLQLKQLRVDEKMKYLGHSSSF